MVKNAIKICLQSSGSALHPLLAHHRPHILISTGRLMTIKWHAPQYICEQQGTTCVYIRNDVQYYRLKSLEHPKFSIVWIMVVNGPKTATYACVDKNRNEKVYNYLKDHAKSVHNIRIIGDFRAAQKIWGCQKNNIAGLRLRCLCLHLNLHQLLVHIKKKITYTPVALVSPDCTILYEITEKLISIYDCMNDVQHI